MASASDPVLTLVWEFINEQVLGSKYCVAPTIDQVNLTGRIVCVTGANTGLGFEAAIHLLRLNPAKLIIGVRSLEKGNAAKDRMMLRVPEYKGEIAVEELDLVSFKSTIAFADRLAALPRLDILLANAAIATKEWGMTQDGFEQTIQVNDLSTGLLAVLSLPLLSKTAKLQAIATSADFKPHLTFVSSEVHKAAAFPQQHTEGSTLAALNDKAQHAPTDRYLVSKLLNQFLSTEISQLPAADDVVVNTVNPGLCVSELRREFNPIVGYILDLMARTTESGATNLAFAATADTSKTPGAYISVCSVKPVSTYVKSAQGVKMSKKVFNEMAAVWKEHSDKVGSILTPRA